MITVALVLIQFLSLLMSCSLGLLLLSWLGFLRQEAQGLKLSRDFHAELKRRRLFAPEALSGQGLKMT